MDSISSKAIIMYQDRVMKKVIVTFFLNIRHRFCLWYILRKILDKFLSKILNRKGVKAYLMMYAYDSQTKIEFEKEWKVLITTYEVTKNK